MEKFILEALNYGVAGLGAVMLLFAWRVLIREQKRAGEPRLGILRFTALFMGFCAFVMLIATFVELHKEASSAEIEKQAVSAQREKEAASAAREKQLQSVRADLRVTRAYLCDKVSDQFVAVHPDWSLSTTMELVASINSMNQSLQEAWVDAGGTPESLDPCGALGALNQKSAH